MKKRGSTLKKVAGPVKVQRMSTFDLLAYLDIIGQVQATLTNASNHFLENQGYGGISAKDVQPLLDEIQEHMSNYGDAQKVISTVINSRFKRDIGVTKSLQQIDKMILKMGEDHPVLKEDMDKLAKAWHEKQQLAEQEDLLKKQSEQKAKVDMKAVKPSSNGQAKKGL